MVGVIGNCGVAKRRVSRLSGQATASNATSVAVNASSVATNLKQLGRCQVAVWHAGGQEQRAAEALRPTCAELGVEVHVFSSECGLLFPQFNPERVAEQAAKLSESVKAAAVEEVQRVCRTSTVWFGWPQGSWNRVAELIGGWPPQLRWIQTFSAGADELLKVVPPGVVVTRAQGKFDKSISEWVLTYMLMHAKKVPRFVRMQQQRHWEIQTRGVFSIEGSVVLIVGLGSIGMRTAQLCHAVGMRVVGTRRSATDASIDSDVSVHPATELLALLPTADFVVLCAPLTPETRNTIGVAEIAAMKRGAALINIARGGLVDWVEVMGALREGRLAAYYTDVTSPEPLPDGHSDWETPNLFITPHNTWAPFPDPWKDGLNFAENLRHLLAGEPLSGAVDRDRGY